MCTYMGTDVCVCASVHIYICIHACMCVRIFLSHVPASFYHWNWGNATDRAKHCSRAGLTAGAALLKFLHTGGVSISNLEPLHAWLDGGAAPGPCPCVAPR